MSDNKYKIITFSMAGEEDFPAILSLRKTNLKYLEDKCPGIEKEDIDTSNFLGVVKVGPKIIGSGRIDKISNEEYKLTRIIIDNNFQGKGLGKKVVNSLETWAKNQKAKKITLKTRAVSQPFYQKLGYKNTSNLYEENNQKYYNMEKFLL